MIWAVKEKEAIPMKAKGKRALAAVLAVLMLCPVFLVSALAYDDNDGYGDGYDLEGLTAEELVQEGYLFQIVCTREGDTVTARLSGLQGEDGAALDALIERYQPYLMITREYADFTITYDDAIPFPADGSGESVLTVQIGEEAYGDLFLYCEGAEAVLYDPATGTYEYFFYPWGELPTITFTDVPDDAWYAACVYMAAYDGLINGKGDGSYFAPDDEMTYAEALALAARMRVSHYGGEIGGEDAQGPWYQRYVDFARDNGIPYEFDDYTAPITRADYIHIFYAALMVDNYYEDALFNTVADGAIPDVSMSHPYAQEIYTFYRMGVLTGTGADHQFQPDSTIHRSEVATVICRLMYSYDLKYFTL
jgi:hypothetical protein